MITSSTSMSATVGVGFSYTITATNLPNWLTAVDLPTGFSCNFSTGVISGTPAATGVYSIPLTAANSAGIGTATLTLTIAVPPAPVITSPTSAAALATARFEYNIFATNSPASFAVTNLPPGLEFNSSSGYIFGYPPVAGTYAMTISAINPSGTGSAILVLNVAPGVAPVITSNTRVSAPAAARFQYYILATGSPAPEFSATGLPPGLAWGGNYTQIDGTPTTPGVYLITLGAENAFGRATATLELTITPAAPSITSASSAGGMVGSPFSFTVVATGLPTSFSATGLPAGLTLDASTGIISGAPTGWGSTVVRVTATNAYGTDSQQLGISIQPLPNLGPDTSPGSMTGWLGYPFSHSIAATNSPTSFGASQLPPGLHVDSATGLISGIPTVAGEFNGSVMATNAHGTGSSSMVFYIFPVPTIASATVNATVGVPGGYQESGNYRRDYTYVVTGLPAGLTFSESWPYRAPVISGTPTIAGTFTVNITATNPAGTGTGIVTIIVGPNSGPPVITSPDQATGRYGRNFLHRIVATNPPTRYEMSYPSTYFTDPHLLLDSFTGEITASPLGASGTIPITIRAINAGGIATQVVTLTIPHEVAGIGLPRNGIHRAGGRLIFFVTFTTDVAITGQPRLPLIVGQTLRFANRVNGFGRNHTFVYDVLPDDLDLDGIALGASVDPNGGAIATDPAGDAVELALPATDTSGILFDGRAPILDLAPIITNPTTIDWISGTPFPYQIFTSGGTPTNYSFTGFGGNQNIFLGALDVSILSPGNYSTTFTITASNAAGSDTKVVTLNVSTQTAPPVISSTLSASAVVGTPFSYQITTSGGAPREFAANPLPAWLSLDPATGRISGTPPAVAPTSFSISAINIAGTDTKTLQITLLPPPPPAAGGWQSIDVGGGGAAGSTTEVNGAVILRGAGGDIWGMGDEFRYRYLALTGDGEIVARVTGLQNTHAWAKAGLMIRESLTSGARNAMVLVSPNFVANLQSRALPNGPTVSAGQHWLSGPRWLRLVRAGTTFTAYHSGDGTNWTFMNSVQLEMPASIFMGLAVTSHAHGTLATAGFDGVSFSGASAVPPPATPTLAAPSSLIATVMSATAVTLNWTDNSSTETAFDIQRSNDNVTFISIAMLGANVTSYAITDLNASTTYYFRLRTLQGATLSGFSNVATATTAPLTAPPPVTGTWQSLDVGGVAAAGSDGEAGGTVTVRGSGSDIWDAGDEFHYRYMAWNGDGEIVARVTGLTNTNGWAKAGLMFRESLGAGARNAVVVVSPSFIASLQSRAQPNGATASASQHWLSGPRWFRLVRTGDLFTGYQSADGTAWTPIGSVTIVMPAAINLGLAVTSHNDGVVATGTFTDVTLSGGSTPPPTNPPATPTAPAAPTNLAGTATATSAITLTWTDASNNETGFEIERSLDNASFVASGTVAANSATATVSGLNAATSYYFRVRAVAGTLGSAFTATANIATLSPPPPAGSTGGWETSDIGAVAVAGSASAAGGTVTVTGSGADIWDGADEFRYRYLSLTDDGEIVARVTGITNTNGWAKAGVMFRETLTAASRHVFMCISAGAGSSFQRRLTTGGASEFTAGRVGSTLPRWVRLVRSGNQFTAFESVDGTGWISVGTVTATMPQTLFVGLAVTSHNDGVLCTGTFGSVSVTGGGIPPSLPPVSPPPTSAVPAPSGLTASAVSSSQVELAWIDNSSDETAFQFERSTDNIQFAPNALMNSGTTSFSDAGRSPGTTYYYRVRAFSAAGQSPFSNTAVVTTPAAPVAPPGAWSQSDVGTPALAGSMEASGNTITLRGSGADIWAGTDSFRFLYRVLTGDCVVETRVTSITNTDPWAKAGVMIRESLEPNARNVFLFLTPFNGVALQMRSDRSVPTTTFQSGPRGVMPPYWVRLVRTGSEIVSYLSPDGITWTQLARYPFPATAPLYVGFAVTAHNNTQLATAVFTDPFIQ